MIGFETPLYKTVNHIPDVVAFAQPGRNPFSNFIRKPFVQDFKFHLVRRPFIGHHHARDCTIFKAKFIRMRKIKYPMQTVNVSYVFQAFTPYPAIHDGE